MNVEIRRNHPSDAADTRALWEEIFTEDSAAFLDYYYSVKTKDNQLQTIRTDGVLTAMIHWNPYPIRICGSRQTAVTWSLSLRRKNTATGGRWLPC